ncbi:hypothetical protein SAMN04489729_5517 [Amycolatopsis lurida]|uniref:hypothetical protein n=1 Tax=Amycolatopsis lurida TaxID=31959 RepID=UPI000894B36C|nr:hypothetical protein [Amycolatopsis lurida]SED85920.1 hypothetical protein SAMN04489729_5517 [Amycolatopsis lurida]
MKTVRNWLVIALLAVVMLNLLVDAVEPFVPYLIVGLVVVLLLGFIYYRRSRW